MPRSPKPSWGRWKVEAGVKGSMELEFDRTGLKDMVVGVEAGMVNRASEGKISLVTGKAMWA